MSPKSEPIRDPNLRVRYSECLGATSDRNRLWFLMGAHCGLRCGDQAGLRFDDVQGDYLDLKEQKTKKRVRRLISSALRVELDNYIRSHNLGPGDYLFPSRFGHNQPITRSGVYKFMKKAAAELGLSHISTHTARKTFGYAHYRRWKDVGKLQRLLNHADPADTAIYIGLVQDEIDATLQDFNPMKETTP